MRRTPFDTERVRVLNDEFRHAGPLVPAAGQWLITPGVLDLGPPLAAQAIETVQRFDQFTADNDPHSEHDFGAFDLAGEHLFWKIDCYDLTLEWGSPDPRDPSVTRRVLTIMLASEY